MILYWSLKREEHEAQIRAKKEKPQTPLPGQALVAFFCPSAMFCEATENSSWAFADLLKNGMSQVLHASVVGNMFFFTQQALVRILIYLIYVYIIIFTIL